MFRKVEGHIILTDAFYAVAKKMVQVYIPAFASLYFGLGKIWGFPAVAEVVGSCAVIATFIGVCLGVSTSSYVASGAAYDGEITVSESEKTGKTTYSLDLKGEPEELLKKHKATFKVPKRKK